MREGVREGATSLLDRGQSQCKGPGARRPGKFEKLQGARVWLEHEGRVRGADGR